MPSLGRGLSTGGGTAALLAPAGPALAYASTLFWGPELAAVPDNYTRVRLDLYWPGVRFATITRYDADGTSSPVRNAEPHPLNTQAVLFDHEAPLDRTCTYVASSSEAEGVTLATDPVYVSSGGRNWLKHPFRPALNRAVHLYSMPSRSLPARRGVALPLDRTDPIVVYQPRTTDTGAVVIQTDGTWAENEAIRAMLADGAPLLIQQVGTLGEGNLYVSVDTAGLALLEERTGRQLRRNITLPFDVVARPPGAAGGPKGITYDDAAARYPTYEHEAAAVPTYADLAAGYGF